MLRVSYAPSERSKKQKTEEFFYAFTYNCGSGNDNTEAHFVLSSQSLDGGKN